MNTQFKKGALELCVLSQLKKGDKYGYELTERISQEMELATGTLYLILKRLKDEEQVETYSVESDGRPARKYYHLTDRGNEYYQTLRAEWKEFTAAVDRLIDEEPGQQKEPEQPEGGNSHDQSGLYAAFKRGFSGLR